MPPTVTAAKSTLAVIQRATGQRDIYGIPPEVWNLMGYYKNEKVLINLADSGVSVPVATFVYGTLFSWLDFKRLTYNEGSPEIYNRIPLRVKFTNAIGNGTLAALSALVVINSTDYLIAINKYTQQKVKDPNSLVIASAVQSGVTAAALFAVLRLGRYSAVPLCLSAFWYLMYNIIIPPEKIESEGK